MTLFVETISISENGHCDLKFCKKCRSLAHQCEIRLSNRFVMLVSFEQQDYGKDAFLIATAIYFQCASRTMKFDCFSM